MQIVEIFSIETSENHHTASNKAGAVSSSGLWYFDVGLHGFHCFLFEVDDENVVQVIAEPSTEDVNFVIVDD